LSFSSSNADSRPSPRPPTPTVITGSSTRTSFQTQSLTRQADLTLPAVIPNVNQPQTSIEDATRPVNTLTQSTASLSQSQTVSEALLPGASERRDEPAVNTAAGNESSWILKAGLLAASSSTHFFNSIFGPSDTERTVNDDQNVPQQNSNNWTTLEQSQQPSVRPRRLHSAEYVLPTRKVADDLIELFFKHTYIPWIDRLKFVRWYERLWTEDTEPEDAVDEQIHYANLNIIFALVYQSEPERIAEDQGHLAESYFLRAQRLLQLNLLDLGSLDLLYALLLLTQWFQSVNNVRQCTSLVRLCIMIAHNLGLHVSKRIESLPNQYQQQLARRAWHGCILMDRITAMISGQPLQISQHVVKQTLLFEAIDDECLSTNKVDGVQPAEKPSKVSFFLAFCKLHIILGDVLAFQESRHDGRSDIDVNHVIEIDNDLDRFWRALPPHLRVEKASQNELSHTGPMVHLHTRFLHIRILTYRVFFLRAAQNLKQSGSAPSTLFADAVTHVGLLTCIRAAQEILELIHTCLLADNQGPHLVPQWWHTVTYVYTAATILIAAHIFPAVVEETTESNLWASIVQGFQILDHHSNHKPAQRCKTALAVLCERHVNPASDTLVQSLNGLSTPVDTRIQGSSQMDAAQISADFGWDFTDPSDLFRGEGMESLLFNTNLFGQGTTDWF
jgi:hypothetical protein